MSTKKIARIGILIALNVVLSRFLSINTPVLRIGFGFVPIAVVAILYGPVYAAIAATIGDVIGGMFFSPNPFFFGFTVSAALIGVIFGVCLYKRQVSILNTSLSAVLINIIITLGLNTFWIKMISGQAYLALLPTRFLQALIMIPVQIGVVYLIGIVLKKAHLLEA